MKHVCETDLVVGQTARAVNTKISTKARWKPRVEGAGLEPVGLLAFQRFADVFSTPTESTFTNDLRRHQIIPSAGTAYVTAITPPRSKDAFGFQDDLLG
jgi:hypothetical protein